MANKLRNLVLASVMTVSVAIGLVTGLAHTGMAAVPHANNNRAVHGQLANYCPAPPFMCTVTRR